MTDHPDDAARLSEKHPLISDKTDAARLAEAIDHLRALVTWARARNAAGLDRGVRIPWCQADDVEVVIATVDALTATVRERDADKAKLQAQVDYERAVLAWEFACTDEECADARARIDDAKLRGAEPYVKSIAEMSDEDAERMDMDETYPLTHQDILDALHDD